MKLTIVVPFHKYGQYLEDCLESIAASGLTDFETLVITDHIEEDIQDTIEKYRESAKVRVFLLRYARTGVAAGRNSGIRAALGEYVYFLDSDDYVMDGTIQMLLDKAEETGADVVYGKTRHTWFKRKVYLNTNEDRKQQDDLRELEDAGGEGAKERMKDPAETGSDEYKRAIYSFLQYRKGLHNISVLNTLVRRSVLEDNDIKFNEKIKQYADMSFVTSLLQATDKFQYVPEAVYVKRRHNDPVTMPAISDNKTEERLEEMLKAYDYTKSLLSNETISKILDSKLVNTFTGAYADYLKDSKDSEWSEKTVALMAKQLKTVHSSVVDSQPGYKKKMISAAIAGDTAKVIRTAKSRSMLRQLKGMLRNKAAAGKFLYKNIFFKMPLKDNYVVFETFMGKNYSDSPKYIYEYLAKHNEKNFKFVWVLNNNAKPPFGGKVIKRMSLQYLYYLAVSKYFVFNVRQPRWFTKRDGQIFLETWHGTPLKRLVFDQEEVTSASPTYKIEFYEQREDWDYLIAANPFSTKTFRSCFKFEKEMLEVGYPRNDLMYHPDKDMMALELKRKMGIPLNKKTILYAPTWRDDEYYKGGQYKFTLRLDLHKMKEELGDEYVILLRTHHYIADNLDVTGVEDFAINLSKYDDITEIYLVSDICITDYSSVFFDYANLKRPVLFYTYDIEKYRDDLRGFYIDMNTEVPGPLLYTTQEVVDAIKNIDKVNEEYADTYAKFYDRFCSIDDGNASKRTVERVFYGIK